MSNLVRMDLSAAERLTIAIARSADAIDLHRAIVTPLLDETAVLLGRPPASTSTIRMSRVAAELRLDANELTWRRDHLRRTGARFPGLPFVVGPMPHRRPHLDGPFADGPFSRSLGGLGPPPTELVALDQLALADLHQFLRARAAAESVESPFDWSAGGAFVWGACSGPVPSSGEDACVRHDFIYRNWRRLRDEFVIDPSAGDDLKAWADDRLGDEVHAGVQSDWRTFVSPLLVVPSFVWAEAIEPAVNQFGDDAWNAPAESVPAPFSGDYYGDVRPDSVVDPSELDSEVSGWICPGDLCAGP